MRFSSKLAGVVLVAVFLVSVLAPVIAYSQSVNIWYAYKNGLEKCNPSGQEGALDNRRKKSNSNSYSFVLETDCGGHQGYQKR